MRDQKPFLLCWEILRWVISEDQKSHSFCVERWFFLGVVKWNQWVPKDALFFFFVLFFFFFFCSFFFFSTSGSKRRLVILLFFPAKKLFERLPK